MVDNILMQLYGTYLFLKNGNIDQAYEHYQMLNPINHCLNKEDTDI